MSVRDFDLNLLVVLDALIEERSVSAAARRLGVSQPNVSFSLNKLRVQFKDQLLLRCGNTMQLTPLAERLQEPLRRVLDGVQTDVLAERKFEPASCQRRFVISTSDIGELIFLPRLMAVLSRLAPQATLQSRSMTPIELETAMAEGKVDLALGYFPDLNGSNFMTQKLFDHDFACIAAADHPHARPGWTLDTFLSLGHIVVAQSGRSQELVEQEMRRNGLERRVQLQSPHFMSVPLLVAESELISTVPAAVAGIFATMARLRVVAPPLALPRINIQQFWHRRVHDEPSNRWLRGLICELFLNRDPSPATPARNKR